MKSGAESTSAARAWQALGADVQHTSDNTYAEEPSGDLPTRDGRTHAVQCCYLTALCAYPFVLAYLSLCTYRSIQTRAWSQAVVDTVALWRVLESWHGTGS